MLNQKDLPQLTNKERWLLKCQQKEKERLKRLRQKNIKRFFWLTIGILVVGGGILSGGWFLVTRPPVPESEIISEQGIHWHTDLSIKILGQYQDISANIGIGITERPIHTHKEDNIIHLEFTGLVKRDDIRLGRFFDIWGKKFNKDCIFDKCNEIEEDLKMFVNGEPNFEFENYIMQNEDKIEIIFE